MVEHAHYTCPDHGCIAMTWETTDVPIGPLRCVYPIPLSIITPINYTGLCGRIIVRETHDCEE